MGYNKYNKYRVTTRPASAGADYDELFDQDLQDRMGLVLAKAKCALAEKLGDVKLRQWCVEQSSSDGSLQFTRAERLFNYIKKGKQGDV